MRRKWRTQVAGMMLAAGLAGLGGCVAYPAPGPDGYYYAPYAYGPPAYVTGSFVYYDYDYRPGPRYYWGPRARYYWNHGYRGPERRHDWSGRPRWEGPRPGMQRPGMQRPDMQRPDGRRWEGQRPPRR